MRHEYQPAVLTALAILNRGLQSMGVWLTIWVQEKGEVTDLIDSTLLEAETREAIDAKLESAGWVIQDKKTINLMAGRHGEHGVAVREMNTDTGPADYMLFIAGKACGIIEAKREGANLGHVAEQATRYATSKTKHIQRWVAGCRKPNSRNGVKYVR